MMLESKFLAKEIIINSRPGVSNLLVSLGHTEGRGVVIGHTLNTQTLKKTDEQTGPCMIFMISATTDNQKVLT